MRVRRALSTAAAALAAGHTLGCWAVYNRESDVDRSPVVNHGAGATIIYPNQSAPRHPGNYHPREAGYGQGVGAPAAAPPYRPGTAPSTAPMTTPGGTTVPAGTAAPGVAVPPPEYASRSGSSTGSPAPGGGLSMLGGTEIEETGHVKINEEPKWLKYLALPFAVAAAPFKYGADKMAGEPAPAPPVPRNEDQRRPDLQTTPATTPVSRGRTRPRSLMEDTLLVMPARGRLPRAPPASGRGERQRMTGGSARTTRRRFSSHPQRGGKRRSPAGAGLPRCAREDLNLHGPYGPQGPQPCASTNSATGA